MLPQLLTPLLGIPEFRYFSCLFGYFHFVVSILISYSSFFFMLKWELYHFLLVFWFVCRWNHIYVSLVSQSFRLCFFRFILCYLDIIFVIFFPACSYCPFLFITYFLVLSYRLFVGFWVSMELQVESILLPTLLESYVMSQRPIQAMTLLRYPSALWGFSVDWLCQVGWLSLVICFTLCCYNGSILVSNFQLRDLVLSNFHRLCFHA